MEKNGNLLWVSILIYMRRYEKPRLSVCPDQAYPCSGIASLFGASDGD